MMRSLPMATEVLPAEEGEAEGCVQCQQGSKLVLFVTGKCHWGCDYCPLSENRRETPDMFANERRCTSWDEVIEEGHAMNATGTGITCREALGAPDSSITRTGASMSLSACCCGFAMVALAAMKVGLLP